MGAGRFKGGFFLGCLSCEAIYVAVEHAEGGGEKGVVDGFVVGAVFAGEGDVFFGDAASALLDSLGDGPRKRASARPLR